MTFDTTETARRLANVLSTGVVVDTDPGTSRAQVQIGDITTPMIKVCSGRAGPYRILWMPQTGEQVVVGAPSGDLGQAMILASVPTDDMAAPETTPLIDLRGDAMRVIGNIIVEGDVIASGISLVNHTHGGVKAGPSSTGKPQ